MSKYAICSCWVLDGEEVPQVILGVPAQDVTQCFLDGKRWAEYTGDGSSTRMWAFADGSSALSALDFGPDSTS